MFMKKVMGRTHEMVTTGRALKEAICNVSPEVLDVSAFKEGLKAANPEFAGEIEEQFSGVAKRRAKARK